MWLMLASMWLSSLLLVQISNAFCFCSVPFCITTPKGTHCDPNQGGFEALCYDDWPLRRSVSKRGRRASASQPAGQPVWCTFGVVGKPAGAGRARGAPLSPTLRPDDVWYSSRYRKEEEEAHEEVLSEF